MTPLLILLAIPTMLRTGWIYPWATRPWTLDPQVHALYLSPVLFAVRGLVILGLFTALALRITRPGAGRTLAAVALAVYGVGATVLALDWVLSRMSQYGSSASGMCSWSCSSPRPWPSCCWGRSRTTPSGAATWPA